MNGLIEDFREVQNHILNTSAYVVNVLGSSYSAAITGV